MTPLSVLRTWGLGLVGWLMLAGGIYLLWEWADGVDPPASRPGPIRVETATADGTPTVAPVGPAPTLDRAEADRLAAEPDRDRQGGWPYLVGGLALVLASTVGGLPIVLPMMLLRREPRYDDSGTSRTIDRPDGSRLHVTVDGPAGAPTLLLTHGWCLSTGDWYYVKAHLADRYRVVSWDLPGLGQSRGADDHDQSLEKMADDLAAVLDATADGGPVVLVGHSIGGMIIQTFCRRHAARLGTPVAGLALVHTTYINPLWTGLFSPLWKALEKPLIVPLQYLTIGLAPVAFLANWQSYLNGSLYLSSRISSFAGTQRFSQIDYSSLMMCCAWPAVAARGNLAMLALDARDVLPTIPVPVLVVGGQNDRLTKIEASETIASTAPSATLVALEPGGHLGHWEQHEEALSALAAFVDRVAAAKAPASGAPVAPGVGRTASPL